MHKNRKSLCLFELHKSRDSELLPHQQILCWGFDTQEKEFITVENNVATQAGFRPRYRTAERVWNQMPRFMLQSLRRVRAHCVAAIIEKYVLYVLQFE